MRTIKVEATYYVEIEIDDEDPMVREYESDKELIDDLVSYRFSILPVIGSGGVSVKDVEVFDSNYYQIK